MGKYRVQFQSGNEQWFNLSGRGVDPSFEDRREAEQRFEKMLDGGAVCRLRLIDDNGIVLREQEVIYRGPLLGKI